MMNSIEFAIKMELDGEKYYKEQAEKNKENALKEVFLTLAKEEGLHAAILQRDKASTYELQQSNSLSEAKDIFKGLSDFKMEVKSVPDTIDVYRLSLEMEKQSIKLYKTCLDEAKDKQEKELYEFLIKQEEDHYAIMDELITLVSRPDEWVESAEFGLRKEY